MIEAKTHAPSTQPKSVAHKKPLIGAFKMQCKYTTDIPFRDLKKLIEHEASDEIWIVFAYYSANLVRDIFESIRKRKTLPTTHIAFSASSVNPLQEIVDDIFRMDDFYQGRTKQFHFDLVEKPLMHAKVIASKTKNDVTLYIGSGNLTNKAKTVNIEAGIVLREDSPDAAMKFLRNLMKKCHNPQSLKILKTRSMFSHFRTELLFLALEESKLRQSILLRPATLQNLISKPGLTTASAVVAVTAGTVNVINRNSVSISILSNEDREELFKCEKKLKTEITNNLAVKLDGFGFVSSLWSLQQIETKDNPVKLALDSLLSRFRSIREKYETRKYRAEMADEIRSKFVQEAEKNGITMSPVEDETVQRYLERMALKADDRKSPYRSLERLFDRVTSSASGPILALLSPYKIGGDENSDTDDEVLSPDQLDLVVMCKLAAKLRSKKPPKAPAVWWLDFALDKNYCRTISGKYSEETTGKLQKIVDNILAGKSLHECLDEFCQITGFNLALRYPLVKDLIVHSETSPALLDDGPYVFVDTAKKRYNLPRFFPAFDDQSKPSELEEAEKVYRKRIVGNFSLGGNLFFWFDRKTKNTYLGVTE